MNTLHRFVCFAAAAALATVSLAQSSTSTPRQSTPDSRSGNPTTNAQPDARGADARASERSAEKREDAAKSERATKISRADRRFLQKAAESGMKEVTVSEAVLAHLAHSQTQQFARMMVRDHSENNQELMALAERKGVQLPERNERLTRKWSEKSEGADDRYMKEMVADHKKTINLFEKGAKSEDPEIAAFAQKTLPKLQQHLQMAQGHRMEH
jgi:putative membrane protein